MQSLTTYIQNPELMDAQVVDELWQLVERNPTYQAAWLLLVRGLYQQQDQRFGATLRKAALMVPDRAKLFELIEGDKYRVQPERRSPLSSLSEEGTSDRTQSLIDSFLSSIPEEPRPRRQHPTDASVDYISYLLQMEDAPAGEDSRDEKDDPVSVEVPAEQFLGLEEVPSAGSSSAGSSSAGSSSVGSSSVGILSDDVPNADSEILTEEDAHTSEENSDEWFEEEDKDDKNAPSEVYFTETLARIYIKQCKYDKAIEIIRRLSLNYPKKSRYFADQIRFLEKLILNERFKNKEK
ncbi:MAG: hypothetical protein IJ699_09315 [Bacteroidaceae bacterium]|nr:hypothetical protein [Bacteroidaceae bacterium]